MANVLKIENLKYKDILKSVTFSLKEKSFNILVGAGGSGKTTLVNCIRGLIKYEGNISLFNNYIDQKNNNYNVNLGFFTNELIFLENQVLYELTNFLKNLNYDEDKVKKKIYNIAKKLDIVDLLFKEYSTLSIYEKTLISFVFSIIHEPKLLIIDNDFSVLDELHKLKIFEYLQNQKKLTILFITTDSSYFSLADNIIFLKDGKIALSGSLKEIIKNEKILIKCGTKLPFCIDLSNKLRSYELLDTIEFNVEEMVNQIWK